MAHAAKHANTPTTHPDFQLPWVQHILTHPDTTIYMPSSWSSQAVNNRFISQTLTSPTALRAHIFLRRPCHHPTSLTRTEDCYILSIGPGVDGAAGRAHGGFSSLILDHITGTAAHREGGGTDPPPATAYMNVQYKAPIGTPAVLIARAWAERIEGRKVFTRGTLEDGEGRVYASAEALFVTPRVGQTSPL